MNLANLQGEERQFLRRLEDMLASKRATPSFTPFLTERQLMLAQALLEQRRPDNQTMFFGGYSHAVRQVLGVFPAYQPPETAKFPVQAITLLYRDSDVLTHRDFLGACVGLLITRDSIGDIVPETGKCTMFVLDSVAPVILGELRKVGRTGVRCQPGTSGPVVVQQEYQAVRGTVSSPRIDALVSLLAGISREKAAKLIQAERVQLNHTPVTSISREFSSGDTVSIRGWGKAVVDKIGSPTRKGRLPVDCRKYR